jgi:hypothetical protein
MASEIEQYKRLCGMLHDALRFYAAPDSYFAIGFFPDPPCGEFWDDFEDIEGRPRPGKRAREVLAEADRD